MNGENNLPRLCQGGCEAYFIQTETFWVHLGSHEPMGNSGWELLRIRPWRHQGLPSHSSGAQWCRLVTWVLSKSWVPRHVSFVHSQRFLVLFSWDCSDFYLIHLWDETESILWNSLISYLTITSVSWATVTFSEWLDCLTRKMLPYRRLTGLLESDGTFWNHVIVRVLKKILLLDSTVATHLSFLGNSVAKISIFIS